MKCFPLRVISYVVYRRTAWTGNTTAYDGKAQEDRSDKIARTRSTPIGVACMITAFSIFLYLAGFTTRVVSAFMTKVLVG